MGTTSSWRTRVEEGIPKNNHNKNNKNDFQHSADGDLAVALSGVGKNAAAGRRRDAGLPDDEAMSDEDDDEDDIDERAAVDLLFQIAACLSA